MLGYSQGSKTGRTDKLAVVFDDAFAAVEMLATRTAANGFALCVKVTTDLT